VSDSGVTPAPEARPAYITMRRAVDVLITGSEPLRVRLQLADRIFGVLDPQTELATTLERCIYGRIASSLVSGGPDEDDEDDDEDCSREALDESIAMLDDDIAVLIARDMLRLYELTAGPPDEPRRWPQERWPDDQRP
jgi:hypothetical protein